MPERAIIIVSECITLADLFTRATSPSHKLNDYYVWGAPVYILDPKLKAGKRLHRRQPRSLRRIFVGFRKVTVPSVVFGNEPPFWNTIDVEKIYFASFWMETPLHVLARIG